LSRAPRTSVKARATERSVWASLPPMRGRRQRARGGLGALVDGRGQQAVARLDERHAAQRAPQVAALARARQGRKRMVEARRQLLFGEVREQGLGVSSQLRDPLMLRLVDVEDADVDLAPARTVQLTSSLTKLSSKRERSASAPSIES
jgi:hypothetical protein